MERSRILARSKAERMLKRNGVANLTDVETVYRKRIRSIYIKIDLSHMSDQKWRWLRVNTPADITELLHAIFALYDDDQEHLVMLIISAAGDLTGFKLISTGSQDSALADVRIIFRHALLLGAAGIIIAHNHPSGDITPSVPDMDMTRKIAAAGDLMNVQLLDHVIYTPTRQLSLIETMPSLFGG